MRRSDKKPNRNPVRAKQPRQPLNTSISLTLALATSRTSLELWINLAASSHPLRSRPCLTNMTLMIQVFRLHN